MTHVPRWFCILLAVTALSAPEALAQTESSGELQEIVVTAQKRSESLQDVPLAVSALSGAELAQLSLTNSRDISTLVPNMRWIATSGTNVSNVYIRGVGDFNFHSNQVGTVGLYRDEVSLNSPILSTFGLFDLERVEVLRGPQNTLFGRNTTGGAVQFISRQPRLGAAWGGYASVSGGNDGRVDVEGAVDVPLGAGAAARLAGARFAQGNYLDNVNLGHKEGGNQNSAGRIQLLLRVTEDLDARLAADLGTFRGSTVRFKQIGLSTPSAPGFTDCRFLATNPNPGNGCSDQTGFIDNGAYTDVWANSLNTFETSARGGNLRLDWRLPALTLTSLTAFEHADSKHAEDDDAGPSYIFASYQATDTDQWSQELRLASADSAAALRWIVGAYYFQEDGRFTEVVRRANPAFTNAFVPGQPIPEAGVQTFMPFVMANQKDAVWSAYAHLDYKLSGPLRLSVGTRFTSEKKSGLQQPGAVPDLAPSFGPAQYIDRGEVNQLLVGAKQVGPGPLRANCPPPPLPVNACYAQLPFSHTYDAVGGNLALDYRFAPSVLGYLSVARGFKAGGISLGPIDFLFKGGSPVNPEYLWTYEAGLKSQWFDNRLRFNFAGFYNRWTDEQLFLVSPTPLGPAGVYVNVPRTESYGAEGELEWVPARDWHVSSSLGLLHSEVKDPGTAVATIGSELLASPKVTWSSHVRKDWPIGGGHFTLQTDWSYTGRQHFDLSNTPYLIEPSYWLWNGKAGYRFGSQERFELSVWGKNLSKTQYCTLRASLAGLGFGDTGQCTPNEATRFFGMTLRTNFD